MTRRIWWLPAAVSAAFAGHASFYALAGQAQNDSHHAYLLPALQYSALFLAGLCVVRLLRALSAQKTHCAALRFGELWLRLCAVQILLYVSVESLEGVSVSVFGLLAQVAVALLFAFALSGFSQLVARCEQAAVEGSRYLHRDPPTALHVFFNDRSPAYALRIAAGTARFQRPPPNK